MKLYQNKYPISDTAEYVVDYVYDNPTGVNYYFQLVRLSDEAILCAFQDVKDVMIHCWQVGIPKAKVAFI